METFSANSLEFLFSELIYDYQDPPVELWQKLYGPQATLSILIDGRVFFEEPFVSIAEFANQLSTWVNRDLDAEKDFIYMPIDSDLPNFLSISRSGNTWQISSAIQKYEESQVFSAKLLKKATSVFLKKLTADLKEKFGIIFPLK